MTKLLHVASRLPEPVETKGAVETSLSFVMLVN